MSNQKRRSERFEEAGQPMRTGSGHAPGPEERQTKMVSVALGRLEKDTSEIRPGMSNVMKLMSRFAPNFLLNQLNKSVAEELAKAEHIGGKQQVVHRSKTAF